MKKYIILIIIVIISVTSIVYLYNNYIEKNIRISQNNKYYEELYNKEINGNDLATLINKTLDINSKNEVVKDKEEYYLNNGTNSIIIEIKFEDSDKIFRAEQIFKSGMNNFIRLYSNINFKCTKIDYHEKTKYISYIYIEQIK